MQSTIGQVRRAWMIAAAATLAALAIWLMYAGAGTTSGPSFVAPVHNLGARTVAVFARPIRLVAGGGRNFGAVVAPHIGMGAAVVAGGSRNFVAPVHTSGALVANGIHPTLVAGLIQVLQR